MSASIKYAYLKGHTWLYRRHYPKDVALVVGQSVFKQSLKTGDPATARVRAAELNAIFERTVGQARSVSEGFQSDAKSANLELPWAATIARCHHHPEVVRQNWTAC
ncbi:DUF6538 domain-containing protein [Sulfitobacter sp.]|uniref:DUF6538 domain-containing protein n=1 Tax=Sulfitobacter sp. TaxID=1903071 RepID=UPI003002C96B